MTAKKRSKQRPMTEISFDPRGDTRTIPSGWQVDAFTASESMESGQNCEYGDPMNTASTENDFTQNLVQ
jgi:hypothetical protein